jgi:hypothetical protein
VKSPVLKVIPTLLSILPEISEPAHITKLSEFLSESSVGHLAQCHDARC